MGFLLLEFQVSLMLILEFIGISLIKIAGIYLD